VNKFFLTAALLVLSNHVFAQNSSLSLDPITFIGFIGFLLSSNDENGEQQASDIRNLWLCMEVNLETSSKREAGFGIFARADRVALRTQYRFFYNKERQSGFFWGLYAHIEWRKMSWSYDENNVLFVRWAFAENDNVYHSIGAAGGFDIGFRIRGDHVGVTPYIGVGIPLYYCFGNLPQNDKETFDFANTIFRAIDIGIRIDFFNSRESN
jgi:hypothetical protein